MSSDEKDYVRQLDMGRHMYAWCLVSLGSFSAEAAREEAEKFYKYEAEGDPYRWLVFHDEAWHWAMLKLFGSRYWVTHPDLESPSADYRAESNRGVLES